MSLFYIPVRWSTTKQATVEADTVEDAMCLVWDHPRNFASNGFPDFDNLTLDFDEEGKSKILRKADVGDLSMPIEVTEEWLKNLKKERY